MAERKEVGLFATPIETLAEAKTVKEILATKEKIEDYFTKVSCVMKKSQMTLKDGTKLDPRYSMTVSLHPTINTTIDNKKMINETEFTLLCYEFLKPVDTTEIKFNGYVRLLRGESDKLDKEDKSFNIIELFISPNLSSINSFLANSTKLLIERLTSMNNEQIALMHTVPFNNIKVFRLSKKESDVVANDLTSGE